MPARYARPEEASDVIASLDTYLFAIDRPVPPPPPVAEGPPAAAGGEPATVAEAPVNNEAGPVEALEQATEKMQAVEPGRADLTDQKKASGDGER